MRLTDLLERQNNFDSPALADLKPLGSRKERILNRWPDIVATPPEKDRERLVQEVLSRVTQNTWDNTPMSLMTSAARALFDKERRSREDLKSLRRFYVDETKASSRQSFLNAMLSVYIGSYEPGARHTIELAGALTQAQTRIGARGKILIRNFPEILDPKRAHEIIAKKMASMNDCWSELKDLGIRSPHSIGLMDHTHFAFIDEIAPTLKRRATAELLIDWLKPNGQSPKMSGASEAITAILEPWLETSPSEEDITYLTESLIAIYGDPRISGGGIWAGVPDTHIAILMRWLTGENIRFFLDVVSAVEENHMWAPRQKFWLRLHERKRIDAAWVAFSYSAAAYARRQLNTRNSKGLLSFGHQVAGGNRADTSLLVLKIGNKIVIEGSHSYKVHIFKPDNPKAPKLYQREYDCERIRMLPGADTKAHQGNWESWVLERI